MVLHAWGTSGSRVITDPSVVERGSTTTSKPGVVRYMAPELLNPTQFRLNNNNPTKESDIYSLALTAYEVLTGIVPYGNARDGIIIFHVVTGDRPSRPQNARWLGDQAWDMITGCWNEQRELRWDIKAVLNQLSTSSTQWITEGHQEVQTTVPSSNGVKGTHPLSRQNMAQSPICVEERGLQYAPNPPTLDEQRPRKLASWGSERIRLVVSVLRTIFRLRKVSGTDQSPSR